MEQFAAIDLGSNSFHLVVARAEEHALTVIDREREMVRLAAGLDEDDRPTGVSVQGHWLLHDEKLHLAGGNGRAQTLFM